jgi:hypothetical protein
MKKLALPVLILALILLACSITPAPTTESPVVTEPPVMTNVTCNELSLYLDPALASGYDCQTVPESSMEFDLYPQHTELTLQGYPLAGKFFEPHLSIYPVAQYTALLPDHIPGWVTALQTLIAGGAAGETSLPFLPVFNAAQVFHAQYLVVPFVSGGGIRFLAEYAQYAAPVNNTDLFYTYQGLTADGQYWISAILPVNLPGLPADATNLPGGVTPEEFSTNFTTYITDMIAQLNAQPAGAYAPSLAALDALVASITIAP